MDELNLLHQTAEETGTSVTTHKGFPNAAAERGQTPLSLDKLLVQHPISTYFFRIRGHSWHRLGMFDGDIAVIDRSRIPREGSIAICWDEASEVHITQWHKADSQNLWGVVTSIIHQY